MIRKFTDAETKFQVEGSVGKRLGNANGCEYVHLAIRPGNVIQSHKLDIPVTFYVISGEGEVMLDEKVHQVETGDLIDVEPHVNREWKNIGAKKLELLVVKHI